jgi:hypothetical protein
VLGGGFYPAGQIDISPNSIKANQIIFNRSDFGNTTTTTGLTSFEIGPNPFDKKVVDVNLTVFREQMIRPSDFSWKTERTERKINAKKTPDGNIRFGSEKPPQTASNRFTM